MLRGSRPPFSAWRRWLVAGLGATGLLVAQTELPPPSAERGLPFFDNFNPRDYQGHTQTWSAAQDAAGVLYFGNFGRVLVYDGARWDKIDVPGTSFVRGVALDAQDTLWIAGVNELGCAPADATGARRFVSLREKLPAAARDCGELWRVLLTPRGPLFQSNAWLLRWDGRAFATLALPPGNGWQTVDAGGTIFVTHQQLGWFTLRDDGGALALAPVARPPELAGASLVLALPGAAPGEFILGTPRHGLLRWSGAGFAPFPTEVDATLRQHRLYRGAALSGGRLAFALLQDAALILDARGRLIARLNEEAGLPDNSAMNVFAARGDQLWVCMSGGLTRVDARPWLTWFGPARGARRSTLGPVQRFRGTAYLASDNGLLRLAPAADGQPARLVGVAGFADQIYGISVVDDTLYGHGLQTLFAWRGGERQPLPGDVTNAFGFEPVRHQPGPAPELRAGASTERGAGRWFAQMDGGLHSYFRAADGTWKLEGRVPGTEHVRSFSEADDGSWWMGTPNDGALHVTFPQAGADGPGAPVVQRFTAGAGLPANHGWVRFTPHRGQPLMFCERGLFRFDAATRTFRPTAEFGPQFADGSTTARTVSDETRDGLWIAARPAGQAEVIARVELGVATPQGWRPLSLPHLADLDDVYGLTYEADADVLWVSGHAGLIRLDLAAWRAAPPPPAPTLLVRRALLADGEPLPRAGGWQFPYARRSLRLEMAAPALGGDPGARFESTLSGDGEPIVLVDETPRREFPALASGHYTLRLRAQSGDGRWSAPVELAFVVLPPWWRSLRAWAVYVLLGAGAVGLGARARLRTLHRRTAALEATVAARTEDLRQSNVELARLHKLELDEKIAARFAEQSARLELLRYQLNPHFLFNALTSIRARVFVNAVAAGDMIAQLAAFFRSTLARGSDEPRTLAEEFATLRTYLDIERARWEDEMTVETILDPDAAPALLPPFLLLPLVENAVKYGSRTSPGTLGVRISAHRHVDGHVIVEVANTGTWVVPGERVPSVESLGIGLNNLRQRLERLYPGAHDFHTREADGWVVATLRLGRSAPAARHVGRVL